MNHNKLPFKTNFIEITHREVRSYFEDFKDNEQSHGMNVSDFIETLLEKEEQTEEHKKRVWAFGRLRSKREIKKMIEIADKIL